MDALASGENITVQALTVSDEPLGTTASIDDALKRLDSGADAIPIQDSDGGIVGWVRHRDMLTALTATP